MKTNLTSKDNPENARRGYLYGFNGVEKDDEVKGSGNSYDFGARIYDPRGARFLSLDPRSKEFSFMSPYVFAANHPISTLMKIGSALEKAKKRKPPRIECKFYK